MRQSNSIRSDPALGVGTSIADPDLSSKAPNRAYSADSNGMRPAVCLRRRSRVRADQGLGSAQPRIRNRHGRSARRASPLSTIRPSLHDANQVGWLHGRRRWAMTRVVRLRVKRASASWTSCSIRCRARWSLRPAAGSVHPSGWRAPAPPAAADRPTGAGRSRRLWLS